MEVNDTEMLSALRTLSLISRGQLAVGLGQQYNGDRDTYTALGYKKTLTWDDYENKYQRQDIARRIVNAPADGTWTRNPTIKVKKGDEKDFNEKWRILVEDMKIFHYILRADRLAGKGEYGVIFLGLKQGSPVDLSLAPASPKELIFTSPYSQPNAGIESLVTDTSDPRYGRVKAYSLKRSKEMISTPVHWSRIIHIAEGLEEDDVYGTPRLKAVYNRLDDVEKISGGSAEMYWRGAFPGIAFVADADADMNTTSKDDMITEIDKYMHNMQRYLRLQGVTPKPMLPQVSDPTKHMEVQTSLISAATGIPRRVLIGSERGELASTQDEIAWNRVLEQRRTSYAEPVILRPFIDRMVSFKLLPPVEYDVDWPDLFAMDENTQATIGETKMRALSSYLSMDGESVLPIQAFLEDILGYTRDQAVALVAAIGENLIRDRGEELPNNTPEEDGSDV